MTEPWWSPDGPWIHEVSPSITADDLLERQLDGSLVERVAIFVELGWRSHT